MAEVGRDLKGRETKVRRWMRDRFVQNNFILYIWQLKLFYFYLSVNCLLLILFLLFNLCGFFFLLSFVFVCLFVFLLYFALFFVNFGGLSLPCHLLCCLLLFVYSLFFIFYLHGFSGFIFCKFNCSWHFFTSSDRVSPGGLVALGPHFGDWYRGVVSYTNDDWESEWADYDELIDMVPRKQLTMGWEDDAWRGAVSGCSSPLAGHGWTIWEMVSIALFFFLSFENPWGLLARCWNEYKKGSLLNCCWVGR